MDQVSLLDNEAGSPRIPKLEGYQGIQLVTRRGIAPDKNIFPLSRPDQAAHRVESQQQCSSAPGRSYNGGNKTSIGSPRTSIDKSIA